MVYLELFHGRHSPDEELDDWGFEGPILGPFPFVHITYGSDIKLGDESDLELSIDKEGYVQFAGAYYGDMSTFSDPKEHDFSTKELRRRINETQKVFQTDPELLISDDREWVKLYCEWRLKNDAGKHSPDGGPRRRKNSRRRDRKSVV